MTFVNLTPHEVVLSTPGGFLRIPPSGVEARCAETMVPVCITSGVQLYYVRYGKVENLPPDEGYPIVYIVSAAVRNALPERHDIASPVQLIRDESGKVVAAGGLATNARETE